MRLVLSCLSLSLSLGLGLGLGLGTLPLYVGASSWSSSSSWMASFGGGAAGNKDADSSSCGMWDVCSEGEDGTPTPVPEPELFPEPEFRLQPPANDEGVPDWTADFNKKAIAHAKEGKSIEALKFFRLANMKDPYRSDVLSNLGICLRDLAQEFHDKEPKKSLSLLRESIAAFDLSVLLENTEAEGILEYTESLFKRMFPGKCLASKCDSFLDGRRAVELLKARNLEDAVNLFCKDEEHATVVLSDYEKRTGVFRAQTARQMFLVMKFCGVLKVKDVVPEELISLTNQHSSREFDATQEKLKQKKDTGLQKKHINPNESPGVHGSGQTFEHEDAASRSTKRYEMRLPLRRPFSDPTLVANRFILAIVKLLMDNKVEIDTFSHVTSLPGAPAQHWHADLDMLWKRRADYKKGFSQLPPQGLVVVIPLVRMDKETGPTQFATGTQYNYGLEHWSNLVEEGKHPMPLLKPEGDPGDIVVFDLRLRHRGTANKSDRRRPIMYLGYVQQWFVDKVNFKDRLSSWSDSLDFNMFSLFNRLDQRQYTAKLEEILGALKPGVLEDLRAKRKYKQVELSI